MLSPHYFISLAINLYIYIILASAIISWLRQFGVRVPYGNPLIRAIEGSAELVLQPIRRHLPAAGGGFDFSPMIAIILLYILSYILGMLM